MASTHTLRPDKLRKGQSWMCRCQAINLYEQTVCKMIEVEREELLEKQDRSLRKNQASQRKNRLIGWLPPGYGE